MVTHRPGMAFTEAIVEPFVVDVIESLLLQSPFEIPIDLGHETEAGRLFAHSLSGFGPEQLRLEAPSPLEDIGQDKHGHVAAHSVSLPGDPQQFSDHRVLHGGVAVVKLPRIGPAGKIRIAPVGKQQVAALAPDPGIILRHTGQVEFRPGDVILGTVFHPRVIQVLCGWKRSRAGASGHACGAEPAPRRLPDRCARCSR
jgi:hypothetical protein